MKIWMVLDSPNKIVEQNIKIEGTMRENSLMENFIPMVELQVKFYYKLQREYPITGHTENCSVTIISQNVLLKNDNFFSHFN